MGLFDSIFGGLESSGKLNSQEAFAGVLLGASACDGHIADDEVQGLMTALLRKLLGVLKKKGVDVLVGACA